MFRAKFTGIRTTQAYPSGCAADFIAQGSWGYVLALTIVRSAAHRERLAKVQLSSPESNKDPTMNSIKALRKLFLSIFLSTHRPATRLLPALSWFQKSQAVLNTTQAFAQLLRMKIGAYREKNYYFS